MYPWNVLETTETYDKKSVKKAYAKLLRQFRPDEHPEAFQEINQAYQHALQIIKNQASQDNSEDKDTATSRENTASLIESVTHNVQAEVALKNTNAEDKTNNDFVSLLSDKSNEEVIELVHPLGVDQELEPLGQQASEQPISEEIDLSGQVNETDELIEQHIDEMFKQTHEMAFSSVQLRSDVKNWSFLEFYHEIHDIYLRDQVAKEMFRRVAEYNLFQKKQNNINLIPTDVMVYMNKLFQWEANWQEYSQVFPAHYIQSNFDGIEKDKGVSAQYRPRIFTRSAAMAVDYFAFFLSMGLLASFIDIDGLNGWPFYILLALFRLTVEMISPNRNSLGVMYLNYRFLDQYLNRPDRKTVLNRFFWYEMSMFPVYLQVYLLFNSQGNFVFLPFYVVFLLVFAYFRKGELPHDFFSRTVAVCK